MKSNCWPIFLAVFVISTSVFAQNAAFHVNGQPSQRNNSVAFASVHEAIDKAANFKLKGQTQQQIDVLKQAVAMFPSNERAHQALALAYLDSNNTFWALRTLQQFEQTHPPACNSRAFQAWIHINEANLELADEILQLPGCDKPDYLRARFALLRALQAAQHNNASAVNAQLKQARNTSRMYAEDWDMWRNLSQRFDPYRLAWASGKLDVAGGWTSNGLAGSPLDPLDSGLEKQSSLMLIDARLRLVLPVSRMVKPVLEMQFRATELFNVNVRALSFRQPSLRPGVLIGEAMPRLQVNYGFDAVQVSGYDRYDQGPLWFSNGHRIDYELEATDFLYVFGGAGRRIYREAGRTRWEAEQGVAISYNIASGWKLATGLSGHVNRAFNHAYDSIGGSVLGQLQVRLPVRFEARGNASIAYENYPRSGGYFPGSDKDIRQDLQFRIKPALWSPPWQGFRGVLEYEFGSRLSTAQNYAFDDHRIVLHAVWTFDSDQLSVRHVPADDREVLRWNTGAKEQFEQDVRIRDLMQQDEAVKRGSSCMK